MSSNRTVLFARAALILFGTLHLSSAIGADPQCYNLASLHGQYAVITSYGDSVARALGMRYYDGNGNFSGPFLINEPAPGSATGQRTVATGTQTGTYTVNCDGTGVITRVVTLSGGATALQMDDFMIMGAEVVQAAHGPFPGQLLAITLADAGRDPSPIVAGGVFVTHTYSRLPDRQIQP
jgi:hypothetical protein